MRESLFEDPKVTPFVECPNCGRLLQFGIPRCPDCCFELIEEGYALLSGAVVLLNTKACAMANTIKTVDVTAPIALVLAALSYVANQPALLISAVSWPVLAIMAIALWFIRFGRFRLGDADYSSARNEMRIRLLGWLVVAASLFGFLLFVIRSGAPLVEID